MNRGDLYWADLAPRSGSEQSGRRPVIVVSHDGFNAVPSWRSIIVIPCSRSQRQAHRGPTAVKLPPGTIDEGDSVALCHQITTLDRSKLTRRIGTLGPSVLQAVEAGILAALEMS